MSPYQWRQLFQGGRFDATTGLYVFGFRDYDPSTGVWRQRDPIGLAGGDVNLYRFVGNTPVVFVDPTGLFGGPPGGWQSTWWEGTKAFTQSIWDNTLGAPIQEASTVWANTGGGDMSTTGRLYTTAGTTVASLVGVRQLSDAVTGVDAVDGHRQSPWENLVDGVSGPVMLGTAGGGIFGRLRPNLKGKPPIHDPCPTSPKPSAATKEIRNPEIKSPNPVKPSDATRRWEEFLGPGEPTNIHPRTGVPDPDRLVSPDGRRSIRYGDHEMNSRPSKRHYHQETWTYDPITDTMTIDNHLIRVPQPKPKKK